MNPFLQLENSKPSYQSLTDPEMQKFHENTGELTSITHPLHPLTSAEHFIQQRGIDILLKLTWNSHRESPYSGPYNTWEPPKESKSQELGSQTTDDSN